MDDFITANLRSRPTRTIISIFAVAIGVILMLIIGGIMSGTLNDTINRTMGVGADFILQPTDSSVLFALSSAALPQGLAAKLQETPGVGMVTPVLAKFSTSDFGLVFGIDMNSYDRFPGRLQLLSGRPSLRDDEVIVDSLYAETRQLKPGDSFSIFNHSFTVSAICRAGAVVRVFVPVKTLQQLNGTPDKVTLIFIKAGQGQRLKTVEETLKKSYPGYKLTPAYDASMLLADARVPGLKELRVSVVFISMLISFMVILLAMYTTIFERTREIGILKSLGASRSFIVGMVLRESVIISCLGALLGTAISAAMRQIITSAFPTLQVTLTLGEIGTGCFFGLLGGILGALYPAYKAAQMDPVKALSYE
jgi:putative ABC transport system permease protein